MQPGISLLLTLQMWADTDQYISFTFDPNGPDPDDCPHIEGIAVSAAFDHSRELLTANRKIISQWMKDGEKLNSYRSFPIEENFLDIRYGLLPNGRFGIKGVIGMRDPDNQDQPLPDPPPLDITHIWIPDGDLIKTQPYNAFKISYPAWQLWHDEMGDFLNAIRKTLG